MKLRTSCLAYAIIFVLAVACSDGPAPTAKSLQPPVIDPSGGRIGDQRLISISSDAAASIVYTLDGTQPAMSGDSVANGVVYGGPIKLEIGRYSLGAIAHTPGSIDSGIASASFVVVKDASVSTGVLDDGGIFLDAADLTSASPLLLSLSLDFGTDGYDESCLSRAAMDVRDDDAGGSSATTEALAMDVLQRTCAAALLQTENHIEYQNAVGKKTDIRISVAGLTVGVSVARAYHFPSNNAYTAEEATVLLEKKLNDINASTLNVVPAMSWEKQLLVVFAFGAQYADAVRTAWDSISADMKGDSILMVVTTDGNDALLY